jgi:hypothetical protein
MGNNNIINLQEIVREGVDWIVLAEGRQVSGSYYFGDRPLLKIKVTPEHSMKAQRGVQV